ncbi:YkuS family protein [Natranaerobius thermophilus]|uniref:YkuS family protein n=1 Tax=Natranaerobius thermophilus TaxID=375929 RepID=UPI0006909B8A|nr:YkuS family protein [Natranaerobius thermophilus]
MRKNIIDELSYQLKGGFQVKKVALEEELNFLRETLRENGYTPVSIDTDDMVSAAIITGRDENMMNIQDVEQAVPVIDARGMDERQIIQELDNRIS